MYAELMYAELIKHPTIIGNKSGIYNAKDLFYK